MKKYIDMENQRYQYMVLNTLNGHSVEVLVVDHGDIAALTDTVAEQLNVRLPEDYRVQCTTREDAEVVLDTVAKLNGWLMVKEESV